MQTVKSESDNILIVENKSTLQVPIWAVNLRKLIAQVNFIYDGVFVNMVGVMEEDEIKEEIVTVINEISDIELLLFIDKYIRSLKNKIEQA